MEPYMPIQLDIGSLEIKGLRSINAAELQGAVAQALQQHINDHALPESLMQSALSQRDELNLQIDASGSVQQIAEQIALGLIEQLHLET